MPCESIHCISEYTVKSVWNLELLLIWVSCGSVKGGQLTLLMEQCIPTFANLVFIVIECYVGSIHNIDRTCPVRSTSRWSVFFSTGITAALKVKTQIRRLLGYASDFSDVLVTFQIQALIRCFQSRVLLLWYFSNCTGWQVWCRCGSFSNIRFFEWHFQ